MTGFSSLVTSRQVLIGRFTAHGHQLSMLVGHESTALNFLRIELRFVYPHDNLISIDNVSFLSRVRRLDRAWLFSRTLHRGRKLWPLHKSRNTRDTTKHWNLGNIGSRPDYTAYILSDASVPCLIPKTIDMPNVWLHSSTITALFDKNKARSTSGNRWAKNKKDESPPFKLISTDILSNVYRVTAGYGCHKSANIILNISIPPTSQRERQWSIAFVK